MSHKQNEIIDGYFTIVQDMETKRVYLYKYDDLVRTIQPGKILSLDELHEMLVTERTNLFFGLSDGNEKGG